jgi:asparagine synthase (glutamine-hydrolysing)
MCGFVGCLSSLDLNPGVFQKMTGSLTHRGPDESNIWQDYTSGISLGHQRLSILDLSSAGSQPMISSNGRFVMVYNGEMYNHLENRSFLKNQGFSIIWKGHSDTETLIELIAAFGIEKALILSKGMFSLALWDKQTNTLSLARDRFGEKPLYYGWQGDSFLFGSELKALKYHPQFLNIIDTNALGLFFQYNYIPSPHSIYKGICKLNPGNIFSLSLNSKAGILLPYWSTSEVAYHGACHPFLGSTKEAISEIENRLVASVKSQLIADVPLGAFLSGGIDSSLIVSIMQSFSKNPVNTFTIGFEENNFNEAPFAKKIASFLGTNHNELYISSKDCINVIPLLSNIYDEPFADSSQIPTYLVSKLAASSVKVSLSGDGGDELFGGYNRYLFANNFWDKLNHFPASLRKVLSRLLNSVSPENWNLILNNVHFLLPKNLKVNNIGDKIHKASNILSSSSIDEVYFKLLIQWSDPGLLLNKHFLNTQNILPGKESKLNNIEKMMLKDLLSYLPDDILCKVDRASMSVSLESRIPFLDHHLFEFSSKLPISLKIKQGSSKWILKEILKKYLPVHLVERPKMGFALPIDQWLRGPLKDWANFLLDKNEMLKDGILNPLPIHQKWEEHLSGKRNWHYHLWSILMFQNWLNSNK